MDSNKQSKGVIRNNQKLEERNYSIDKVKPRVQGISNCVKENDKSVSWRFIQ